MDIPQVKKHYYKKTDSQKVSEGIKHVQKILLKRFKLLEKLKNEPPVVIDQMLKLSNAIAYNAQVFGGLTKVIETDRRLTDIEKALKIRELMKHSDWNK